MSLSAWKSDILLLIILTVKFQNTHCPDILFGRVHILRTLYIFRLEKILVKMMHGRKLQLYSDSVITLFSELCIMNTVLGSILRHAVKALPHNLHCICLHSFHTQTLTATSCFKWSKSTYAPSASKSLLWQ